MKLSCGPDSRGFGFFLRSRGPLNAARSVPITAASFGFARAENFAHSTHLKKARRKAGSCGSISKPEQKEKEKENRTLNKSSGCRTAALQARRLFEGNGTSKWVSRSVLWSFGSEPGCWKISSKNRILSERSRLRTRLAVEGKTIFICM